MEEILNKIQEEFKDKYLGSTANDSEMTILIDGKMIVLPLEDINEENIIDMIKERVDEE